MNGLIADFQVSRAEVGHKARNNTIQRALAFAKVITSMLEDIVQPKFNSLFNFLQLGTYCKVISIGHR